MSVCVLFRVCCSCVALPCQICVFHHSGGKRVSIPVGKYILGWKILKAQNETEGEEIMISHFYINTKGGGGGHLALLKHVSFLCHRPR